MIQWTDKLITDYVISMGDGTVFTPLSLYMTWNKRFEFNIAQFNFKELAGTLVKRGTPQGMVYDMEIIFQGGDNLDMSDKFLAASVDKQPWTITHPFYGNLYVQPMGLAFENGNLNQTIITCRVIETLLDSGLQAAPNPSEAIVSGANVVYTNFIKSYAAAVPKMKVSDLQALKTHIDGVYRAVLKRINFVQANANKYTDAYNNANRVLNTAIYDTQEIIGASVDLVVTPAAFVDTVVNRLAMFSDQLRIIDQDIARIASYYNRPTKALKTLYENNGGVCIGGMCVAAVTNITDDYNYRPAVIAVISTIVSNYNDYINNLNELLSDNGSLTDSYIPDVNSITSLTALVNLTTTTLLQVAANSLQQRTYVLPYDDNVLVVAHKLYPTMNTDSAALLVIANNNIGNTELFLINKDRKIIYYV